MARWLQGLHGISRWQARKVTDPLASDLLKGELSIARLPAAESVPDWLWPETFSSGAPHNSFVVIEGDQVCPEKRAFPPVCLGFRGAWVFVGTVLGTRGGGATSRLRRYWSS